MHFAIKSRVPALLAVLALGVASLLAVGLAAAAENHALVRLWIDSEADQAAFDLQAAQLDIASGRRGEYFDVVVPREELAARLDEWRGRGGRVEVRHEDLETFYASRLDSRESFGAYHSYSEALAWLDQLHAQYPAVISARWSIGLSHNGIPLWCVRVSDNPETDEEGEPEVLFDGEHHAREVMASEMVVMLAEYLGQQYAAGNPAIVDMLNETEIYLVPMVNPDGFLYNEQTNPNGGGMWRKNRRNNGGSYGVDCNRNYPYEWGCDWGSSGSPTDETYRGPSAGSEPEVQAMMTLINTHDFVVRMSYHTYANLTLFPWGYTNNDTPDHATFVEIAQAMCAFNGYTPGQPGEVLYAVCGDNFDWDYGEQFAHTKIFGVSTEIGGDGDGFWPSDARRVPLFNENIDAALYLIEAAHWLRGVTFTHQPLPFTAAASGSYPVVATPVGYENTPIDPASVALHYRVNGGEFQTVAMTPTGNPGEFGAGIPAQVWGSTVDYYLQAADVNGNTGTSPRTAPAALHTFEVGNEWFHDMEAERGWTPGVPGDDAISGLWIRVDPVGTTAQPEDDHSAEGTVCWVTGQHVAGETPGYNDVDGGTTTLLSPIYDLTGAETASFGYWSWYSNNMGNNPNQDWWDVLVSNDGGASWLTLEHTMTSTNAWVEHSYDLLGLFPAAGRMQLKFTASDASPGSLVEAAVDDVRISATFGTTGVDAAPGAVALRLEPNAPNPFNPRTTIRFSLPAAGPIDLGIYNVKGQLVRRLYTGIMAAGTHGLTWDGTDTAGRSLASGVYLCKLVAAGGEPLTRSMVLMK